MALKPVTRPERRLLRAGTVLWVGVWLVLAIATAVQIRRLSTLTDTVVESGEALDAAGRALQAVGDLPIVGEATERLGDRVRNAAGDVEEGGESSRDAIDWLSVLLGLSIMVVPVTSVLAARLPQTLAVRRDRRAVEEALQNAEGTPRLEEFLARRAVQHLPYDVLTQVTADPWGDLRSGAFRRLANAELTRLGLAGPKVTRPGGKPDANGASR